MIVVFEIENQILVEIIKKLETLSTHDQLLVRECVNRLTDDKKIIKD